jgi:hypothetical protein
MKFQDVEKVVAETINELEKEFGIDLGEIGCKSFDELVERVFSKMTEWERRKYETLSNITKNREFKKASQC